MKPFGRSLYYKVDCQWTQMLNSVSQAVRRVVTDGVYYRHYRGFRSFVTAGPGNVIKVLVKQGVRSCHG